MSTKTSERISFQALKTIPLLVGTQLITRIVSFSLRLWTIRNLLPEQVAFSDVQLALFSSLSLMPWREGFRPTSLRFTTNQQVLLNWYLSCGFYFTCLIGFLSCVIFWRLSGFSPWPWALELVALCLEALSDIHWVQLTQRDQYKERSLAEGTSLICCTTCLILLLHFRMPYGFAVPLSHIAYSCMLNICFLWLLSDNNSFLPCHFNEVLKIPAGIESHLWITFYSVLRACPKFLLGDGENIILILLNDIKGRGNYKFSANLGSLILRFLFRPLEEQAHIVFSRYASDYLERSKRARVLNEWKHFLCTLLRFEIVLCSSLCILGPFFIPDCIALFFGNQWKSSVFLLECYSYYIFAMGLNGLLEAFYTSVGDRRAIANYTYYSWFISLCYLGLAYFLSQRIGIVGLLIANIANMFARSLFCFIFVLSIFSCKGFRQSVPSAWFWVALFYGYVVLKYISSSLYFSSEHVTKFSIFTRLLYRTLLLIPLLWVLFMKESRLL
ncbi:oligosaccharidyl-lipid flippase, MOP family [Galdieria sulphuraria]|uniref:Protein RFT1 homolog n=1 Tax=Galdieria sulphuraria TaxID=130081 RepID=M2Y244_GALSU|nr:oligosaccharidyl-lipid flippase, MOP family [Galdieria sulphuraria]EME30043.1 oligosaccharidyl-lipid flippase, MOP family [Galdieria sulphuraria]|eukprot:XP_005706563.1 oligosaccharidyl-lipid flippase, MOP family [Galdieria sulphuraria]